MAKLTNKQRQFIEHYITCLNSAEAARRAGYSEKTARSIGSENLTKPDIQEEVQRRLAETAMTADEVIARLADQSRASLEDFVTIGKNGPHIDLAKARRLGKLHLLKRFRMDKDGDVVIELHDPQAALVHLGRYHALFVDKTALTDPTGKHPAPIIVLPEVLAALQEPPFEEDPRPDAPDC